MASSIDIDTCGAIAMHGTLHLEPTEPIEDGLKVDYHDSPAMMSLTAAAAAASMSSGGGGGGAGPRNSSYSINQHDLPPSCVKQDTSGTLATKIVLPANCLPPIAFIAFPVLSISLYITYTLPTPVS